MSKRFGQNFINLLTAVGLVLLATNSLFAAGFEKAVLWSAKSAGIGGADTSSVKESESVVSNPAGLAGARQYSIGAHISPTKARFKSPMFGQEQESWSGYQDTLPMAVLMSMPIKEAQKWGLGFGFYPVGGSKVSFDNINVPSGTHENLPGFTPRFESNLKIMELALGAGYQVNQNWSIGAALRATMVRGSFESTSLYDIKGSTYKAIGVSGRVDDISATEFGGYKLGAQYTSDNKDWGLGVSYRSKVDFKASGMGSGKISRSIPAALGAGDRNFHGTNPLVGGPVTLTNTLPAAIDLGGHWELFRNNTFYLGHTRTLYSSNKEINIQGTLTDEQKGEDRPFPSIGQNWKDMSNYRFGYANTSLDTWTFRGGYIYTNRVTNKNDARPTFSVPGDAHTFTLGSGKALTANIDLDFTAEYSFSEGYGQTKENEVNGLVESVKSKGKYENKAYAGHFSMTYRF